MIARYAELEDWSALKEAWNSLQSSPHAFKIEGRLNVLRAYFLASLTGGLFGIPLLVNSDQVVKGFAVLQECIMPQVADDGLTVDMVKHTFVRALYVEAGVPKDDAVKLEAAMEHWARSRGHVMLVGNCRLGFKVEAMKRAWGQRGWAPAHVVVQKDLRR